jgi:hypothetical protein
MDACRIWRQPADCIYPRRPFRYEPDAFKIDRYLNRLLLELVKEIRIEQGAWNSEHDCLHHRF